MKMIIEEYGAIIVSSIIGITVMGIGIGMIDTMSPILEIYISSLM